MKFRILAWLLVFLLAVLPIGTAEENPEGTTPPEEEQEEEQEDQEPEEEPFIAGWVRLLSGQAVYSDIELKTPLGTFQADGIVWAFEELSEKTVWHIAFAVENKTVTGYIPKNDLKQMDESAAAEYLSSVTANAYYSEVYPLQNIAWKAASTKKPNYRRSGSRGGGKSVVSPGLPSTSKHGSGNRDRSAYWAVKLTVTSGAQSSLTLDKKEIGISFADSENAGFTAAVSDDTLLVLTAVNDGEWTITGTALQTLYESGIENLCLVNGQTGIVLPVGDCLSGPVYNLLRSQGIGNRMMDISLKITDGLVSAAVLADGETYTASFDEGGEMYLNAAMLSE